ncbi:MAG: N(pi)-phosphohistidine--sugar phosphotransferase [Selenomonadaceae bacterium]|nr:N(pi)-phosphohistidine--sugar phosphotransferase [Selenomonadaceae bacterium]
MEVKFESQITAVGEHARTFLETNSSVIILNEGIRPNLDNMVVRHTVTELHADIEAGDRLKMGNTEFKVVTVGELACQGIREEGHCTIVVNEEITMPGQIAVKGAIPPRLRLGDIIQFYKK